MLFLAESTIASYQQRGSLATTAYFILYQPRTPLRHRAGLWFVFQLKDLCVVMGEKNCSGKFCLCPLPATYDNYIKWVCQ